MSVVAAPSAHADIRLASRYLPSTRGHPSPRPAGKSFSTRIEAIARQEKNHPRHRWPARPGSEVPRPRLARATSSATQRFVSNICQTNGTEQADFGPLRPAAESPNHLHSRAFRSTNPYHPNTPNLAHNPKVAGSNPAPATPKDTDFRAFCLPRGVIWKSPPNGFLLDGCWLSLAVRAKAAAKWCRRRWKTHPPLPVEIAPPLRRGRRRPGAG